MSNDERIAALERRIAELERRAGLAPAEGTPADAPPAAPQHWSPPKLDYESLVGRYGTLVLATVSALAAVGTFIGWAIANGMLGPSQRIALGLVAAAGLAVGGLRLRRRERSFGASLLGLSLAITMVCAWGAGPSLHLVPAWAAFALAALTSIALAVFAHAEDDEPLWSVGFSGAAVAPFVTASGRSDLLLLAAYGIAVQIAAGYAMGSRPWTVAGRLFLLAASLYTGALATGFESDNGPLLAMAYPLVVALGGVIPWMDGWTRRDRLRILGSLAAIAAVRSAIGTNLPFDRHTIAGFVIAAGVLWLIIVDRTHAVSETSPKPPRRLHEGDWLDAGVLPLAFAVSSAMALDGTARVTGWAFAGAAIVLLVSVARDPEGSLRDAAAFATLLCALIAVFAFGEHKPLGVASAIAILSALAFAANVVWRSVSWVSLGLIGFFWAAVSALVYLGQRPIYDYTPFATRASAVALVVFVSLAAAARLAVSARGDTVARWLLGATIVWGFLWVHQEIVTAFNPTAAMLLRVSYYAMTSVAAVAAGRARRQPLLRHAGLALAVLAAATALYGARRLESIGARVGADLVAAVFLLAIAYWYRRPGGRRGDAPVLTEPPSPVSPSGT